MIVRAGLLCFLATASVALANEPSGDTRIDAPVFREADSKRWYDIRQFGVEGQPWKETKLPYDRFPAKAEGTLRPDVWTLSRNSAGLSVRFETDSPTIEARWTLNSSRLAMTHMPATGVSGLDLYARDAAGKWRWVACAFPRAEGVEQVGVVATGIAPGRREYLLYLPLYNGVAQVEIGVPATHQIQDAPAYAGEKGKPIVFYGTSITHGGCASRPGMVHTAILQRWYNRPVVNLGFSGNGRMEPEVTALLGEIDASIYVIDCCPNMSGAETAERTRPLVHQLRKVRPDTPIVLVEDRRYTDSWLLTSRGKRNDENHTALKAAFDDLTKAGVKNLYYIPGDDLLGDDAEGAVDGSHPTDLGFLRQAEAFDKVLAPLVGVSR